MTALRRTFSGAPDYPSWDALEALVDTLDEAAEEIRDGDTTEQEEAA